MRKPSKRFPRNRYVERYVIPVEEVFAKPLRRGTCRNASECNPARNSHVVRVPHPSPWNARIKRITREILLARFSASG